MKPKVLACSLLLLAGSFPAVLADTPPAPAGPPYSLSVVEERVSLRVEDGSVVTLIEDLGRRLGFEVVAQGVADARVTLEFDDYTPGAAIRAICKRVGYVEVPDPETGRTVRVVLTPGATAAKNRLSARREPLPARPEPPQDAPVPPPQPSPAADPPKQDDDDTRP